MYLRRKKYLKWFVLAVIFFHMLTSGCDNDNPLAPYDGQNISIYFPLEKGNTVRYIFECRYSQANGQASFIRLVKGNLTMTVTNAISHQEITFAQLSTNLLVLSDSSWDNRGPGSEIIINGSEPYSIVTENNLIQSVDSVWKVAGEPDFNHLDEGNRSLVMHLPFDNNCKCKLDLSFIVLSGWDVILAP